MKKKLVINAILVLVIALVVSLGACSKDSAKDYEVSFDVGGEIVDTITVEKGGKATAYDEGAWYTDKDFTEEYDFASEVTGKMTLYGKAEFNVSFSGEGISTVNKTVKRGEKVIPPEVDAVEGKTTSWTVGSMAFDFNQSIYADYSITLTFRDIIVEAVVKDYYGEKIGLVEVNYGDSVDLSGFEDMVTHPYSDFYTFAGWDKSTEGLKADTEFNPTYDYNSLPEDIFKFELLDDGTYGIELKKHTANEGQIGTFSGCVGLPEEHDGVPVTRIMPEGLYTYYGDTFIGVEKLLVPSSYKIIGWRSFYTLYVRELILAEGVEELWSGAFFNCEFPQKIVIPSTIKYIEEGGLYHNTELECNFNDTSAYKVVDNAVYSADMKELVCILDRGITEFVVPAVVEKIHPSMFSEMTRLQSVVFEGDLDILPAGTFYRATSLTSVEFKGKVREIWGVEKRYPNMKEPECNVYKPITDGSVYDPKEQGNLFNAAFFWNRKLVLDKLPEGLEYIDTFAINTVTIKTVEIGPNMRLGTGAFVDCDIENIIVDANNPYYAEAGNHQGLVEKGTGDEYNGKKGDSFVMYANMNPADTFAIPDGVTTIQRRAIQNYSNKIAMNLKTLTIPEGVQYLARGVVDCSTTAAAGCNNIETLYLPSTLTEFEEMKSYYYSGTFYVGSIPIIQASLKTVIWPDCKATELPIYLFRGTFISSFEIPASVTSFDTFTIENFAALDELEVTVAEGNQKYININHNLYEFVDKEKNELKLVYGWNNRNNSKYDPAEDFKKAGKEYTLVEICDYAYTYNCYVGEINLPEGLKKIGDKAFYNAANVSKITLPSTLEYIGDKAFGAISGVPEDQKAAHDFEGSDKVWTGTGLKEVEFKSETPPTMGYDPQKNGNGYMFDAETLDMATFNWVYAPPEGLKIKCPEGHFYDYMNAFFEHGGETYANLLDSTNVTKFTYKFVTGGGSTIADKEDAISLFYFPITLKTDSSSADKYFQGWFTKDGTSGGDWGEEITEFPYTPKASDSGTFEDSNVEKKDGKTIVTLYAKWGNTKIQNGLEIPYAFDINETPTQIEFKNGTGQYWLEIKPEKTGRYKIVGLDDVPYGVSWTAGVRRYSLETNTFSAIPLMGGAFSLTGGQTYYISLYMTDYLIDETGKVIEGSTWDMKATLSIECIG